MAIYGISFYGLDKYGYSGPVEFDASPFVAEAEGYDRIALSWHSPDGVWEEMRVLRNWTGVPVDENDGEVIATFTGPASSEVDWTVRPGAWHYYAIWVRSSSGWSRAAVATTLMLTDHGYGQRLFEHLPRYNRMLSGALDDGPSVDNDDLKAFLQVLAVGLDYIKTYYDSLRVLNDPMRTHLGNLVRLAEQLGVEYLPATPSALFRGRVLNASTLSREKGTLEQIRTAVGMSVGWDVEITQGPNLMLSEDTASFVHPVWPDWDAARNYPAGERVTFGGLTYEAKVGGAYGEAQKPPGTAASTANWLYVSAVRDTTYVGTDGSVAGWGARSYTAGVTPGAFSAALGLGVQSATDPTVLGKNCLYLLNNNPGGVAADLGVSSVLASSRENAVKRGVPIPPLRRPWDAATVYEVGDIVTYANLPYVAVAKSEDVAPSGFLWDNDSWRCLGVDGRPRMTSSVFVKGGSSGAMQTRTAYPTAEFYDDKGNLIVAVDVTTASKTLNHFDAFVSRPGILSGRSLDVGGLLWNAPASDFRVSKGAAAPADPTVPALATIAGSSNGRVSVTFDAQGYNAKKQALVARYSGGANNNLSTASFIKVTRTGLFTTNAGVDTTLLTFPTPATDGDRVTLSFVGSNLKVWVNNTVAGTATSSLNSGSTSHGMLVA